jgi:ankyrin repeat protein
MTDEWRAATAGGDLAAIDRLLSAGADVDARDEHGQTALMNAARDGQPDVVQLLIAHGADLNHRAKYNLTAVMLAVVRGHLHIVKLLVAAGADLSVRGAGAPGFHNQTAADLARARGDVRLAALLDGGPV